MDSIGGGGPPVPPRMASSYGTSPWSTMTNGNYYSNGYMHSSYPSPYSGYHQTQNLSSFLPANARGPFETVESFVHAISSISLLLDNTYSALLASVRSVFAVGEQLRRMRSHMGHLYSAVAFSRLISWLQDHFGWVLGRQPTPDLIWNNVKRPPPVDDSKKPPHIWPLIAYMAFLIGAPYLTYRFTQPIESEQLAWTQGQGEHFVARAEYSFEATRSDELSFTANDSLKIAPTELQNSSRGWLLAANEEGSSGLVPANRIKILGKKVV